MASLSPPLPQCQIETITDKIFSIEEQLHTERAQHGRTLGVLSELQEQLTRAIDSATEAESERKARIRAESLLAQAQARCERLAQKLVQTVRCRDSQVEQELQMAKGVLDTERSSILGTVQPLLTSCSEDSSSIDPTGTVSLELLHDTIRSVRTQLEDVREAARALQHMCASSLNGFVDVKHVEVFLRRVASSSSADHAHQQLLPSPFVQERFALADVHLEEERGRQKILLDGMFHFQHMCMNFNIAIARSEYHNDLMTRARNYQHVHHIDPASVSSSRSHPPPPPPQPSQPRTSVGSAYALQPPIRTLISPSLLASATKENNPPPPPPPPPVPTPMRSATQPSPTATSSSSVSVPRPSPSSGLPAAPPPTPTLSSGGTIKKNIVSLSPRRVGVSHHHLHSHHHNNGLSSTTSVPKIEKKAVFVAPGVAISAKNEAEQPYIPRSPTESSSASSSRCSSAAPANNNAAIEKHDAETQPMTSRELRRMYQTTTTTTGNNSGGGVGSTQTKIQASRLMKSKPEHTNKSSKRSSASPSPRIGRDSW
eukprot:PhM_4_TR11458/c0_g1_i1/m.13114